MNIDDLTIGQARELVAMITGRDTLPDATVDNGMIGKFVIVRCHDAGVHAGYLKSYAGRACVLADSRRLWYWKPAEKASFLSGVAAHGLHSDSKVGEPISVLHLTENCEIMACTEKAERSIKEYPSHVQ